MMDGFVLLRSYFHRHDAELIIGLLRNNGIEAVLQSDDAGGYYPNLTLGMGNNRVLVPEQDLKSAVVLLDSVINKVTDEDLNQIENIALSRIEPKENNSKQKSIDNLPLKIFIVVSGLFLFLYYRDSIQTNRIQFGRSEENIKCREIGANSLVCKEFYKNKNVRWVGSYNRGKLNGDSKEYYENGQTSWEGVYVKGEISGPFKEYFENGVLKAEGNFKNGKLEEEYKEYYESGKLMGISYYKNNEPHGTSITYSESGKILDEIKYRDGYRFDKNGEYYQGVEKFRYENGNLWEESIYKNGKLEGISKVYFENGVLESEANYLNGKLNGEAKSYFKNGQIKFETIYKDNNLIFVKQYNMDGDVIFVSKY